MAFKAAEASDALLLAMQARVGAKASRDVQANAEPLRGAAAGAAYAAANAPVVVKTAAPIKNSAADFRTAADFTVKGPGADHSKISAADNRTAGDFTVKPQGPGYQGRADPSVRSVAAVSPDARHSRHHAVATSDGAAPMFAAGPVTTATPLAAQPRSRAPQPHTPSFDERFAAELSGPAFPFSGNQGCSGNSRPSSGALGRSRNAGLPPTPPRASAWMPAHERAAPICFDQPEYTALDRAAAEQVRAAKAQEDILHDQCSEMEERLRRVEQGQAAAAAAAAALDTAYASSEVDRHRENGPKLPSAVTVGGVPVATDGELVYLGGGLYAATSAAPREHPQASRRPRVLPGRTRPNRTSRELGKSAAVRSASAHIVGPQSCAGARGESSPPSRAQSDGQLGMGGFGAPESGRSGDRGAAPVAKCWRPGGVQKLPVKPPDQPARSGHQIYSAADGLGAASGNHSEARAMVRSEARRDAQENGTGLFGQQGVLAQLREGEAAMRRERDMCELREMHGRGGDGGASSSGAAPVVGAPLYGDRRAAERKAVKQAKVDQLLEERAQRLAVQAATAPKMHRGSAGSASAPALPTALDMDSGLRSAEDIEKQKLRVACKMEILDFFNGYSNAVGKMTADQTKMLLAKLHNKGSDADHIAGAVKHCEAEREDLLQEQDERAAQADGHDSIQRRLQQVNDLCNKAMVPADAFDGDLDLDF